MLNNLRLHSPHFYVKFCYMLEVTKTSKYLWKLIYFNPVSKVQSRCCPFAKIITDLLRQKWLLLSLCYDRIMQSTVSQHLPPWCIDLFIFQTTRKVPKGKDCVLLFLALVPPGTVPDMAVHCSFLRECVSPCVTLLWQQLASDILTPTGEHDNNTGAMNIEG